MTENRPIALLAGFDAVTAEVCRRRLDGEMRVLTAGSEEEVLAVLAERPVAALCLGAGFPEGRALDLLEKVDGLAGAEARVHLVLAGGVDLSPFQDWIDRDRLFYLPSEPIPADDVAALLRSALERRRSGPPARGKAETARRLAAAVGAVAGAGSASAAGRAVRSSAAEPLHAGR
ncbi:MAG TPA: hypothetical protein DD490_15215, partial [Acidobacteria bacterium]|nr:hypothetical protein [Acidobacteriota bacterium]